LVIVDGPRLVALEEGRDQRVASAESAQDGRPTAGFRRAVGREVS